MPIRTVFLDREGVITPKLAKGEYVLRPEQVELAPEVAMSLWTLGKFGCRLFIVSNQSCVGRGLITYSDALALHRLLLRKLNEQGVRIEDSLLCPHVEEDECACRKPNPGMILNLCSMHGLSPRSSVMIGDSWTDMQAAEAAGCQQRILIADMPADSTVPTFATLAQAVRWMVASGIV